MIDLRIRKSFAARPDSRAFTLDLSLRTEAGITVLFGPSGAGKTLTLDCIAGFVQPDEGRILIDDRLLFDAAARVSLPSRERRCGYVFQNYALFPHLTLRENLAFAGERLPRLERRRAVAEMLERFSLGEVGGRRPHELSGGQKQRGSIARALLAQPRVLLLDEPARGLDPALRLDLYDLLREVRSGFPIPILLVTHDLDECFELGEYVAVVDEGVIVQSGSPAEVLASPANTGVARLLGRSNLLAAEVRALDPVARTSRFAVAQNGAAFEFTGPYFPGRLLGDRITLAIAADEVRVAPRGAGAPAGGLALELVRVAERPQTVRLHFQGSIVAEVPRSAYESARAWMVYFPSESLRLLK